MLLMLMLVLTVPYLLLSAADRLLPGVRVAPATRGKVGLTAFFLVTGSGHFLSTAGMAEMLPPFVPLRAEIVYATGVLQVLAAIGIWVPRVARLTGFLLIVMLVGILPANVYSAFARVPFGGHDLGPAYLLVRVPFQFLVIAWTYLATGQRWLRRAGRPAPRSAPEPSVAAHLADHLSVHHPFLPLDRTGRKEAAERGTSDGDRP